jgi:hypothetical protein
MSHRMLRMVLVPEAERQSTESLGNKSAEEALAFLYGKLAAADHSRRDDGKSEVTTPLPAPTKVEEKVEDKPKFVIPVGAKLQAKAKLLLKNILNNTAGLTVEDSGKLTVYGKPIQGSNIVDIIQFLSTKKARRNPPVGLDEITQLMVHINTPISYVLNDIVKAQLQTVKLVEEDKWETYDT